MAASTLPTSAQATPEDLFQRNELELLENGTPPKSSRVVYIGARDYGHWQLVLGMQHISKINSISLGARPLLQKWPHRLLDVPTMTSIERSPGNWYGTDFEPTLNALSYRWGKWTVKDGPRLEIHGVSWGIPAVDQNDLSPNDFQKVFQRMTH